MAAKAVASSAQTLEQKLDNPPVDGITNVVFAAQSDLLLASSWDKTVRLYDAAKNTMRAKYEQKAGVLDVCFQSDDDTKAYCGGIDRNLVMIDLKTGKQTTLGTHEQAIRCVQYSSATNLVVSGSWDCSVSLWDARSQQASASATSKPAAQALTASATQPQCKIYTMSLTGNRLVVGTSGRHVFIYDLRNLSTPDQVRESSLMNQTRCIRCIPDGSGYALSSIEGRVAIEYFDPSPQVQKKKYAFKCHRKTNNVTKAQTLYPVNSIAFHPLHLTFATGGCDGLINVWDWQNKKRICQYLPYATSIAAMDFSRTGEYLAVAASYTFEEGEKEHPNDAIFVRTVNEHEVKPKSKPTA
jgi:cell cycle arrest protein BUB3